MGKNGSERVAFEKYWHFALVYLDQSQKRPLQVSVFKVPLKVTNS